MSYGSNRRDTDLLSDIGYPVYRRLFNSEGDFVGDLDTKLAEARMATPVELYISRSLTLGMVVGFVFWVLGSALGYGLFALGVVEVGELIGIPIYDPAIVAIIDAIKIPALVLATGLFFGSFGFVFGFGALVIVPYFKSSGRKREINMLLPDAISFMYALSVGGLNQLEIIDAMARADDTYGEVAKEFQSIVQETEYFDTDYRTAIRDQSLQTPSDELSQFLTDMLSILNSGGDMTEFLDDKKDKHMRTAKQEQETTLETLELFGEMYMTLSLFPLLLLIVLVVMGMVGSGSPMLMWATVYGLIPMVGVAFLVLISTVKQDEIGDGYLQAGGAAGNGNGNGNGGGGAFSLGAIDEYVGEFGVFEKIRNREGLHVFLTHLKRPHIFFRDHPLYTLALTTPIALGVVGWAIASGRVPLTLEGMKENPVGGTFLLSYVPLYITLFPLAVFHEWNVRSRKAVIGDISDNLRKLSSANDTGLTLLESIETVADTSTGKLANEFETMYAKVQYGTSLKGALIEFNNKYHIPRLARTVKLISKAQEASSQITSVLNTAAQASENQDDLDREQKSRARMQVVIILMTYFTLLAVMAILKSQFLDVMSGLTESAGSGGGGGGGGAGPGGGSFGANLDVAALNMMFFHAVTIQAVISGMIAGYIRSADLQSGVKYVVILMTVALLTWIMVA
jgi:flagellar protein FlaJ